MSFLFILNASDGRNKTLKIWVKNLEIVFLPYLRFPDSSTGRDSDLVAQDLYSKFYRFKLEMFNFPIYPGKFGIYQMQSYFR